MAKRVPKSKFPTGATVDYERALVKMVNQVGEEALKLFDKHISNELMHGDAVTFRSDGIFDSSLKSRIKPIFSGERIRRIAERFVKGINRVNRKNFEQQARVQGIDLVKVEPWLDSFLKEHIQNNVRYIKNLEDETYSRIEKIVREHIEKGSTAKVIREAIMEQTDISKSRAQFLAVDQAGTIMAQITAERHQRLGIEKFVWDTSGDERVRDSHRRLDGEVFSYDDPPEINGRKLLPGEDYRCRCVALPVFDEDEENEIDEPNFLRVNASPDDYPNDYKAIQRELEMIPENHRKILEDTVSYITIVDEGYSRYDRKTGVVYILEDIVEGELIHELGHALETKLDLKNNKKFKSIITDLLNGKTEKDIYFNETDYPKRIRILKSERFISEYQGFIYNISEGYIDNEGAIKPIALAEYFAEGYREFIMNPSNLKKRDKDLYEFIKELIL